MTVCPPHKDAVRPILYIKKYSQSLFLSCRTSLDAHEAVISSSRLQSLNPVLYLRCSLSKDSLGLLNALFFPFLFFSLCLRLFVTLEGMMLSSLPLSRFIALRHPVVAGGSSRSFNILTLPYHKMYAGLELRARKFGMLFIDSQFLRSLAFDDA